MYRGIPSLLALYMKKSNFPCVFCDEIIYSRRAKLLLLPIIIIIILLFIITVLEYWTIVILHEPAFSHGNRGDKAPFALSSFVFSCCL